MPIYKYAGRTRKGTIKKGTINATNKTKAVQKLREQGISPREIHEAKGWMYKEVTIGRPVKHQDFVIYCRQFATLIRAGVSIVDATNILSKQTESKMLSRALSDIEEELRTGKALSDSITKYPKIFPPIFINMVRAGEASGNLDETLDRLATYFEKQYDLKKKVQSALAYPITLMILIVAVVVFLMVTIVPRFTDIFAQFDTELPMITQFVVGASHVVQNLWWLLVVISILMILVFSLLIKKSQSFHYFVHVLLLKIPVFGKLLQKSVIARMTRTLSSLFSSSVPILQALTMVERVVNNPVIGKVVLNARNDLEKGDRLMNSFEQSPFIPPLVTHMTAIGEETGSLDFMLSKIADFYEAEVDRTVETLKSLIEPFMIVILAFVIGTIVLAIMLPMFSMYQQF